MTKDNTKLTKTKYHQALGLFYVAQEAAKRARTFEIELCVLLNIEDSCPLRMQFIVLKVWIAL
jgi:hypothetical protein